MMAYNSVLMRGFWKRLENALRNFSTLTLGDMIQINYNDKVFSIKVLDVKPNFEEHSGISIVETDLEV